MFAAKHNAVDTARLLIETVSSEEQKRKIIEYCDPQSLDTTLHVAAQKNHVEFAQFLLNHLEDTDQLFIVCPLALFKIVWLCLMVMMFHSRFSPKTINNVIR